MKAYASMFANVEQCVYFIFKQKLGDDSSIRNLFQATALLL